MFTKIRVLAATFITTVALAIFAVVPALANNTGTTIEIPSIGVNAPIVEAPFSPALGTWDVTHLHWSVGHMQGTPFFGQPGNITLGAHSIALDGAADVFLNLSQVGVGESIFVTVNGSRTEYRVVEKKNVGMYDTSIIRPTTDNRLTIFTCDPHSFVGNDYTRRDVLIAVPVG